VWENTQQFLRVWENTQQFLRVWENTQQFTSPRPKRFLKSAKKDFEKKHFKIHDISKPFRERHRAYHQYSLQNTRFHIWTVQIVYGTRAVCVFPIRAGL
jgi:hypothetical protein